MLRLPSLARLGCVVVAFAACGRPASSGNKARETKAERARARVAPAPKNVAAPEDSGPGLESVIAGAKRLEAGNLDGDGRPDVSFGTPGMAREFERLYRDTEFARDGIAVMAGHEEGLVTFGSEIAGAARRILRCRTS